MGNSSRRALELDTCQDIRGETIAILGHISTGKTFLYHKLIGNNSLQEYQPTRSIEYQVINGIVEVIDTPGLSNLEQIQSYMRIINQSSIILLTFSYVNRRSFSLIVCYVGKIRSINAHVNIIVVGNGCGYAINERCVTEEEAIHLCTKLGVTFKDISEILLHGLI